MKLFPILLILALAAPAFGDSESSQLARKARKAQSSGDFTEAYLLYTRASTLDPGNKGYRNKIAQLRAKVTPTSPVVLDSTPEVDPATAFDNLESLPKDLPAARRAASAPGPEVRHQSGQGDFKTLFTSN